MTTPSEIPVAYAMPIGGGWAYYCAACFVAHRDDPESDPDAVAACEPIAERIDGEDLTCELCGLAPCAATGCSAPAAHAIGPQRQLVCDAHAQSWATTSAGLPGVLAPR